MKFRRAVENAGIFQKKKLSTKYELEIKAFEGSEKRLEREGIDPAKVNTAQWNTRIAELTTGIRTQEKEKGHYFRKSQSVREAKKEMERLFIDKGIDYEMRHKQEINRMRQERKRGRGR